MKFAFTLQYDGAAFSGYQIQHDERTVQGELEKALKTYFRQPIRVHCAGRTDTGVHAMGQVVHFEASPEVAEKIRKNFDQSIYSINCILPDDIGVIYAAEVPSDFHARFSCEGREYCYRLIQSRYKMPFYKKSHYWLRQPLDIPAMRKAAEGLLGEHDFRAFTKKIYERMEQSTIRRIDRIEIIEKPPFVYLYFAGSGFLHNMIRIISGTLICVGRNELTPEQVVAILNGRDRVDAGVTLPAHPLVFVNASYRDYRTPRQLIPLYQDIRDQVDNQ